MKGLTESAIWAILAVIVVAAAFFLTMPIVQSDGWVNQTLNVTSAVTCTVATSSGGTAVQFGNISAGGAGYPSGQTSTTQNTSAINVTAGATNNALMAVNWYGADWTSSDGLGHTITIATNELWNVTNTTNFGIGVPASNWITKTSFPTTATQVDVKVNQSQKTFLWLNMTVPSGAWGGSYSSNLTILCGVS